MNASGFTMIPKCWLSDVDDMFVGGFRKESRSKVSRFQLFKLTGMCQDFER